MGARAETRWAKPFLDSLMEMRIAHHTIQPLDRTTPRFLLPSPSCGPAPIGPIGLSSFSLVTRPPRTVTARSRPQAPLGNHYAPFRFGLSVDRTRFYLASSRCAHWTGTGHGPQRALTFGLTAHHGIRPRRPQATTAPATSLHPAPRPAGREHPRWAPSHVRSPSKMGGQTPQHVAGTVQSRSEV